MCTPAARCAGSAVAQTTRGPAPPQVYGRQRRPPRPPSSESAPGPLPAARERPAARARRR
eukprot:scaffold5390_cov116-Isochrysis_galbana.AAC.3